MYAHLRKVGFGGTVRDVTPQSFVVTRKDCALAFRHRLCMKCTQPTQL